MKKKAATKKLTKNQLKKLKGGDVWCKESKCYGGTCGAERSYDHCSETKASTVNIVKNPGSSSK